MYLLLPVADDAGVVLVLQYRDGACVEVDGIGYVLTMKTNIYNVQFHYTN